MKYYTLGYYNPIIVKVRYKAEYQPCELLCDLQQKYYPFDVAYEKLKNNGFKYTPFVDKPEEYKKTLDKMCDMKLKMYSVPERVAEKLRGIFRYLGFNFPDENRLYC